LGTGRKLLLADDSVTIQKVVDLTFADEGMQVLTVSDGEQAVRKLEEFAPDIVLLDVFMPKLNGYQVCEHIKRDERFRHIPVMLLVGSFEPFDEVEARRVGADDYLTKPFQSIKQLINKVGALVGRSDQQKEQSDEAATAAEQTDSTPPSEMKVS
jgi:CheY-like chemotaxis protein